MPNRQTEIKNGVRDELAKLGITDVEFGYDRRSHQLATFKVGKHTVKFHFALTPSKSCWYTTMRKLRQNVERVRAL